MYYAPATRKRKHRAWYSKTRDCSCRSPHQQGSKRKQHTTHSKRSLYWFITAISNPRFANCATMDLVRNPNAKDCPTTPCLIMNQPRKNKSTKWPHCWHHWKPIQHKTLKNPKRPSHCILERMNTFLERWEIFHWFKGRPSHANRIFCQL